MIPPLKADAFDGRAARFRAACGGIFRVRRGGGSASVVALAVGLALLSVGLGLQGVGAAVTARHRAALAADLAALSGALHVPEGATAACARAGEVARLNRAQLSRCEVIGRDIVLTAEVVPPGPAARAGNAQARARAGPI
ncbi:Rv3654c family TadE-like protein [Cryptosporangium phraense]|uniref:Flp pilus-assembly TadE/G-like family protein n=1 Tax=Cryptosporangium phraense TaxID=2593070 RepID=A0A545AR90_9ACTN|nr:flp pilus-assembly TadE/G-like family protein [Cryptosporangium phraense]